MNYYVPFRNYFEPLMEAACPKTDALIRSGFQQSSGGYIEYARRSGMDVDYKMGLPTQGWHFIRSYLDRTQPEKARIENIVCGELIYWLAEVSNALTEEELDDLAIEVRSLDRRQANSLIKDRCFSRIVGIVMNEYNKAAYNDFKDYLRTHIISK